MDLKRDEENSGNFNIRLLNFVCLFENLERNFYLIRPDIFQKY